MRNVRLFASRMDILSKSEIFDNINAKNGLVLEFLHTLKFFEELLV